MFGSIAVKPCEHDVYILNDDDDSQTYHLQYKVNISICCLLFFFIRFIFLCIFYILNRLLYNNISICINVRALAIVPRDRRMCVHE